MYNIVDLLLFRMYNLIMEYEWDENKNSSNTQKHGVPFGHAEYFNWESAQVAQDDREEYGEDRFVAIGYIDDRLHVMAFTVRGDCIRIISLRKANPREVVSYEQT